ncbi:hypothetical protein JS518_14285 [Clostridiales bacterium FE2010]|nr:hypothetical protein JS518_14285 [Clostridiales bacterium FE2010]
MILRPTDSSGDILPVFNVSDMMTGKRAGAELTRNWLNLFTGEWWENPSWGNEILDLLKESRLTETDQQVLATYLSSYIRKVSGIQDVRNVKASLDNRQLHFVCEIETEEGSDTIHYSV